LGPPDLTYLGDKIRPAWLYEFLKKPHTMRFWLKIRMPDFRLSDKEANSITRYFSRIRRDPKAKTPLQPDGRVRPMVAASIGKGKDLFALYECAKCHPAPGASLKQKEDTTVLAPSLEDAGERLNQDWVFRFLQDPQSIYPGTKMPNFFYDSGEPMDEEAEKHMVSIIAYLMSLKR
jgi:cbb3-type cytochrome oxidase cytochrome c subunit